MSGYQPQKDCAECVYLLECIKSGKRKKAKFKNNGNVWCKDFLEKRQKPPNTGSIVQSKKQVIRHIHIDISKEFLEEYKAEIERDTAAQVIDLLECFNKKGDNNFAIKLIKTRFQIER